MQKATSVEEYIEVHSNFTEALQLLRTLLVSTELEESLKWGAPVYTIQGKNVIGLVAFKNHCVLWFHNGVFLKDEKQLLIAASKTTKALRQMRFESVDAIDKTTVLAYIKEAIQNQKLGKELKPEKKADVIISKELQHKFGSDKDLAVQFQKLTPFKKREFVEYIDTAKREETKLTRLDKIIPMIKQGIGLNDKYKNC